MTKTKRAAAPPATFRTPMPDITGDDLMRMIVETLGGGEDTVAQFANYLDGCGNHEDSDRDRDERIADLIGELDDVRIACNGGDRKAREDMRAVHDLLSSALDRGSLGPVDLIMTGKIFHDAGWPVPDALKQAVGQELELAANDDGPAGDVTTLLADLTHDLGGNPFEIYEFVDSILAVLPSGVCDHLLAGLAALRRPQVNHALAGFLLHPDSAIANAAANALLAIAHAGPVESLLIERLVQMRPWLPQDRQAQLDSLIKALRPHALPPHELVLPKLDDCYVSICDGSGARSASIVQRTGSRYSFVSILIKPSGIREVVAVHDLPKSAVRQMSRQMKSAVPTSRTDIAGIARMLRLGLAANASSGDLPPFRLVEIVESLGLPPLYPDHASAAEIIEELLTGLLGEQTDASATAKAHAAVLIEEVAEQWFEAGEAVEDLLRPLKSRTERVTALMASYLPSRRQFWAHQCAISALALHAEGGRSYWKQLALVGRDIASDLPLERIPFMQQIAAASVLAFESQA